MVLRTLALVVLLVGCKQSLFDSHGDDDGMTDGGGSGSNQLPATCPSPCVGDGGGDFDGTPMGSDGHWRYLEDAKNRTWTAMTASGNKFVGATSGNEIASCKNDNAAVCAQLPGGLLFSSAGGSGPATAVEWVAPTSRVVQVQLGVRIPDGGATQTVRLYRSSREDSLFSATADPGVTVQKMMTLDVLQGERLYVTMDGDAVTKAGVQLFVVGDPGTFPSTCVVAAEFEAATGNTIDNLCGTDLTHTDYDAGDNPSAPTLGAGPFTEEGMAATLTTGKYYLGQNPLPRTGDFTIQYWAKFNGVVDVDTGGWTYSDLDLNAGGGIGQVLFTDQMTNHLALSVQTCTDPNSNPLGIEEIDVQYPQDMAWHFVRVVGVAGTGKTDVSVCVDGMKLGGMSFTVPTASTFAPYFGKNVVWTPSEPSFNGSVDDLRVLSQALPCN